MIDVLTIRNTIWPLNPKMPLPLSGRAHLYESGEPYEAGLNHTR